MIENATVRVVIPTERPLLALIHRVVEFLVRSGPLFEAILMARERQNHMYRFLFDNHHPTHVYYRWRLYAILQGDDRQKWRLDKFRMFEGGSWWQPPPHSLFEQGMPPQLYDTAYVPRRRRDKPYEKRVTAPRRRSRRRSDESSDEEDGRAERRRSRAEREREREERKRKMRGILANHEREELEKLLRTLVPEKIAVGDAMVWCLDHAECSKEITQCLFESLCIKETPLHKKIARIYLISDILANCSARIKDAFYFRQHFGDYLLKIFVELNDTLENIESRLKAEQFRQRVMLCFRIWEDNAIYPTELLIQCQNVFLGLVKHGTDDVTETSSIDGEPLPLDDVGEEVDFDGEPLPDEERQELEEDIDGMPMTIEGEEYGKEEEEDIDGIPMDGTKHVISKGVLESDNRFTIGSWNTIEIDEPSGTSNNDQSVDSENASITSTCAKSKWESIDLHSRWDRQERVAREFVQQQQEEDEEHSPMRKKHKLSRLSPENVLPIKPNHGRHNEEAAAEYLSASIDDEDRRRMLREIEVKVMRLQDDLESEGSITNSEITAELNKYRQRLMSKMEKELSNNISTSKGERKRGVDDPDRGRARRETDREERDRDKDREEKGRRKDSLNGSSRIENREEKRRDREHSKDQHRDKNIDRDRRKEHRSERDEGRRQRSRSPSDGLRRHR